MALVHSAARRNGLRLTSSLTSRTFIAASAASAATALAFAAAAPAAAAPSTGSLDTGSLDTGSLQQGENQAQEESPASGSLDALLPQGTGSLGVEANGADQGADETAAPPAGAATSSAAPGAAQGNAYAETPPAPGTFNPDAIGELSPQTIGAVGVITSAAVGSTVLSLGPYGPSTGSALVGGLLPGVAYVPATSSLGAAGSGEFATSLGVAVSEQTIFQGAVGIGTTILTGYFEGMATKQDAAELTNADIELWDGIINSVDELRAVASLPPIERGDPYEQVPVPEPCRRGFAEKEEITEDEADELCEEAMAEQEDEEKDGTSDTDVDDAESEGAAAADDADEGDADDAPAGAEVDGDEAAAPTGEGTKKAAETVKAANPTAGAQLAGTDAAETPESIAAEPQLANTGVDAVTIGIAASLLIATGGAFVLVGRRARS